MTNIRISLVDYFEHFASQEEKDKLLWGDLYDVKDEIELNEAFKLIDEGEKQIFRIENFNCSMIPDDVMSIKTGAAGLWLLYNNCGIKRSSIKLEPEFDPIESNEMINPRLKRGYRLSSYMMIIERENGKILKLIPINETISNIPRLSNC